jgi:hypothetical protein
VFRDNVEATQEELAATIDLNPQVHLRDAPIPSTSD